MPASLTTIRDILNYNFGCEGYITTLPTIMYFGLSLSVLTSASIGSTADEPTATTYHRAFYDNVTDNVSEGYANDKTTWTTEAAGALSNNIDIVFNGTDVTPGGSGAEAWGEIKAIFIADSSTTGDGAIIWYANLNPTLTVGENTLVTFLAGSIMVSMT
jgi:hypothetical protein